MSPRTSCTVATEFSACSTGAASVLVTGAVSVLVTGAVSVLVTGLVSFSLQFLQAQFLEQPCLLVVLEQYLFYLSTLNQVLETHSQ
jgi:hypothetical protein